MSQPTLEQFQADALAFLEANAPRKEAEGALARAHRRRRRHARADLDQVRAVVAHNLAPPRRVQPRQKRRPRRGRLGARVEDLRGGKGGAA